MSLSTLLLRLLFFFGLDRIRFSFARLGFPRVPIREAGMSALHMRLSCVYMFFISSSGFITTLLPSRLPLQVGNRKALNLVLVFFTLTSASQRQKRDTVWRTEPEQLGLLIVLAAQTGLVLPAAEVTHAGGLLSSRYLIFLVGYERKTLFHPK